MITKPNPCIKCTKRSGPCHDTCKEHHEWLAEFRAEQASLGGSVSDAYAAERASRKSAQAAKYKQNQRLRKHKKC